jgi:APA family basic amino acid/polyamine antiporter
MAFAVYAKPLAPQVSPVLLSSALVALITLVHLRGLASTSRLQNIFTTLKVALIMCFIGAGLAHAQPQTMTFTPSAPDWPILVSAPFGVSLIYVMYAYSGWNAATYIINEIKDPARCLPRALIGGTLLVTVLYVGLNWVFLRCAPVSELRGQLDVGFVVARHLFGPTGSLWVSGLIALMLVSLVSAMVWAGPRVTQVMGEDLPALRWLSHGSSRGVPARAIVSQWVLVQVLIVTASYQQIMMATQWVLAFCSFLTVMGVFVLRWREPELPRPFRVWGYPFTPLLFALIAVFTMGYVLKEHPLESGLGLGWMLLGLVLYGVTSRKSARTD